MREEFKEILESGVKVLILKNTGICECVKDDGLYAGESDYDCKKCYGTGSAFTKILTEKIRKEESSAGKGSSLESQEFEKNKGENNIFYFPFNYDHLNSKDIICTLKHDNRNNLIKPLVIENFFKVVGKVKREMDDFIFLKITGEKIKYV